MFKAIQIILCLFLSNVIFSQERLSEVDEVLKSNPKRIIQKSHKGPLHFQSGWKNDYKLNDFGKPLSCKVYFQRKPVIEHFFLYNDKKLIESEHEVPANKNDGINEHHTYWTYSYDNKGRVSTEYEYLDSLYKQPNIVKDSIVYDTNNNVISYTVTVYPKVNKLAINPIKSIFGYNENNQMLYKINPKGKDSIICRYTYDENKLLKSVYHELKFPNGIPKQNIIGSPNIEKLNYSYSYVFDNKGNWVERYIFYEEKKYLDCTRKIYY